MIKTTTSLHWLSRPLIFALALMLIIGAGFPTPTRAQNDSDATWYWATTPEGIVAYTLDGEINLVLPSDEFANVSLTERHLADNMTLLASRKMLYVVTPKKIINIFAGDYSSRTYFGGTGEIYSHPYLIIWSVPSRWGVVQNVETGERHELKDVASDPRLLSDGQTIRYVAEEYSVYLALTDRNLIEYSLVTQGETVLYSFDLAKGSPFIASSDDGMLWLIGYTPDLQNHTFAQIDTVGDISQVFIDWLLRGEATIDDNYVVAFDKNCNMYCSVRLYPFNSNEVYQILLPGLASPPPLHITPFSDGSYFIQDFIGNTLWGWYRTRQGDLNSVGIMRPNGASIIPNIPYTQDEHWVLALADTYHEYILNLWDLQTARIVVGIPIDKASEHRYSILSNQDTVLLKRDNKAWKVFDSTDNTLVDIRNEQNDYFHVLPHGQLLFEAPEGGIYLFHANTEATTLLVPKGSAASPIWYDR